jgi:ribosomal protein L29
MKKSVKTQLRQQSVEELKQQAQAIREGQLKARLATRSEGKVLGMSYRKDRRQLSRIETILGEKAATK